MINYFLHEIITSARYKIIWINLFVTPFFMFAPFIFLSKDNLQESILVGLLCWYQLNQMFFGISNCFIEERLNGTFVNFFIYPIDILNFLVAKGLWILVQTIVINLFTIFLFSLFSIYIENLFSFVLLQCWNGGLMFMCSVFYLSFVIKYERLGQLNGLLQQLLGFLSGYTTNINIYPSYLKKISFLFPLTYVIILARMQIQYDIILFIIPTLISLLLCKVGIFLIQKHIHLLKLKGEIHKW